MQILSLHLSLSLSVSLSQKYYFFFFNLANDTVQTPLKTEEGFRMPPVSTPHVVVGSVLAKPQAGRWKPSLFPFPLAGNTPSTSAYRPHGKAGSASCHLRC